MLGPIGLPETLFILVLALLIFGPRRLPELGRTVGKALGEFRRATTELKRSINTEIALEDDEPRPAAPRRPTLAEARPPAAPPAGAAEGELPEGEEGGQAVWRPPAEPRAETGAAPPPSPEPTGAAEPRVEAGALPPPPAAEPATPAERAETAEPGPARRTAADDGADERS